MWYCLELGDSEYRQAILCLNAVERYFPAQYPALMTQLERNPPPERACLRILVKKEDLEMLASGWSVRFLKNAREYDFPAFIYFRQKLEHFLGINLL